MSENPLFTLLSRTPLRALKAYSKLKDLCVLCVKKIIKVLHQLMFY